MNIFVGNIAFTATENDVRKLFEAFGAVSFCKDKEKKAENGNSRGLSGHHA